MSLVACKIGSLFDDGKEKASGSSASTQGGIVLAPGQGTKVNGRSNVPTLDEWGQAPEVTVRRSSALGCSTKMVREWLRVSCSGKNDSGGTPTTLVIERGGNSAEMFTFASGGVTSLVIPFVEGLDLEAAFAWTDRTEKFLSRWPRGAPKPSLMGEFVATRTPPPACVDCRDAGDEARAKAQGRACCAPKTCRRREDCAGSQVCCTTNVPKGGGVCRAECDLANSALVCNADADCRPLPRALGGGRTRCRAHPAGVKACQP
jgi:hypothetical protein